MRSNILTDNNDDVETRSMSFACVWIDISALFFNIIIEIATQVRIQVRVPPFINGRPLINDCAFIYN